MKPINAFLNIHNGKVVASTIKKPNADDFRYLKTKAMSNVGIRHFGKAITQWQSSILGEPDNWYYGRDENYQEYYTVGIELNYIKIEFPNHPCQVEVGKEVTVIKL